MGEINMEISGEVGKHVVFEQLGMKNFCNHIDPVELNFEGGKLVLITGPNGSGKTSLIQALPYTLYGICEKGRGEDVLNDKIMKNCHTWVTFSVNGVQYRVDRYVKYSKLGTTTTLMKNGNVTHKGHKEVVPEIEKLLVPRKLFMNTLLFGQKIKTFFTDLNDSEQKEIFRKILKLDDYVLYHQEAGQQLKDIEYEIIETNNKIAINMGLIEDSKIEIQKLTDEKNQFYKNKKEELLQLEVKEDDYQDRLNIVEKGLSQYEGIDQKLEQVNKDLGSLNQQLTTLESKLEDALSKVESQAKFKRAELVNVINETKSNIISDSQLRKTEIVGHYSAMVSEVDSQLQDVDRAIHENIIVATKLNGYVDTKKSKIDDLYIDQDLTVCPTCQQDINEEVIKKIDLQIGDIVDEIAKITQQISEVEKQLESFEKQKRILLDNKTETIEKKDDELKELQDNTDKKCTDSQERLTVVLGKLEEILKHERDRCDRENIRERENLEKQVSDMGSTRSSLILIISERDEISKQLQQLKIDIATNKEAIGNKRKEEYNDSTLISLQIKEKGLRVKLKELSSSREEFNEIIKMTEFWREGFSSAGIQSMLIDEAIPFMNLKISDYMDKLSNGRYSVSFDTMKATKAGEFRDKISVRVFDNNTHADTRVKLSGGQERLVDVGTILTLCDLQSMIQDVEFNLILFDEIFDSLDDENIGYVANLIKKVSKDKWVGVISHRCIDQIEADEVLTFR